MRRSGLARWARINRLRTGETGFAIIEVIVVLAALGVAAPAARLLS